MDPASPDDPQSRSGKTAGSILERKSQSRQSYSRRGPLRRSASKPLISAWTVST
jgi:hypothetical protein